MSGQLNIRTPKSTDSQIADLIEWTGMTQTQIVIQGIDRLHQSYKKERNKVMNDQVIDRWANMMLDEATDAMDEKGIGITPESLSEYFEKEYELPFTPAEAQKWLSEQDWYKK